MAVQRPSAAGIFLCRTIVVEENTRNVTLVNTIHRIEFTSFPSPPTPLEAYSVLCDGMGEVNLKLVVTRCATLDEIYSRSTKIVFHSPLLRTGLHWKVRSCVFPAPGDYEFSLQADGETITQAVLRVIDGGSSHG
jgi:hypothetical protein